MNEGSSQSIPPVFPGGILDPAAENTAIFYFCNSRPSASVVGQLLEAAVSRAGRRALVLMRSTEAAVLLSRGLWAYHRTSFLPHGVDGPMAPLQPALITSRMENVNGSDILVLPDGGAMADVMAASGDFLGQFGLVLTLYDASASAMNAAAEAWREIRARGYRTMAFEREIPKIARSRHAGPVSSDFDMPVPLRWHRKA